MGGRKRRDNEGVSETMFRATDNRCSRIVDEAERKRLEKKSRARMAAVKSPMKITAPKKANKNTKKILERRVREQVGAFLRSFSLLRSDTLTLTRQCVMTFLLAVP